MKIQTIIMIIQEILVYLKFIVIIFAIFFMFFYSYFMIDSFKETTEFNKLLKQKCYEEEGQFKDMGFIGSNCLIIDNGIGYYLHYSKELGWYKVLA